MPCSHKVESTVDTRGSSETCVAREGKLNVFTFQIDKEIVRTRQAADHTDMATATQIVEKLKLNPHQEGGFFSETFRDTSILLPLCQLPPDYKVDRPVSTAIYFLLPTGDVSRLHRIPCAETWHFYLGEPLTVMELNEEDGKVKLTNIGPNFIGEDQVPQYTVPPNVWFGAFPIKDFNISPDGGVTKAAPRDSETHYSLVGCTCAPAFQFQDFELAKRSELIKHFPDSEPLITLLTDPEKA